MKSYLLAMKDLKERHSGLYLNEVLLETLRDYNIEYNITRYLLLTLLKKNYFINLLIVLLEITLARTIL